MKINQTDTEIEIEYSNDEQRSIGIYMLIIGLVSVSLVIVLKIVGTFNSFPFLELLLGVGFIAGGAYFIRTVEKHRTIIRKGGKTTITTKRIPNGKTTEQSFATSDIIKVNYFVTYKKAKDAQYRDASHISLLLKGERKILIDMQWAHNFFIRRKRIDHTVRDPLAKESEEIANFLSVPLDTSDFSGLRPMPGN